MLRVVNKDMTYATQLKDYEDAVISKRFEELQEDEVRRGREEKDASLRRSSPFPSVEPLAPSARSAPRGESARAPRERAVS